MGHPDFAYGGAAVLVELHERHLEEFHEVWLEADRFGVELPPTSDPNYASRATLLAHVLGCATRYLSWICQQLGLPEPEIEEYPDPDGLTGRSRDYLEEVLAAWRPALVSLTEERAYAPAHPARWGTPYCIDAMLEHAVMHPIRHTHQLRRLLEQQAPA